MTEYYVLFVRSVLVEIFVRGAARKITSETKNTATGNVRRVFYMILIRQLP